MEESKTFCRKHDAWDWLCQQAREQEQAAPPSQVCATPATSAQAALTWTGSQASNIRPVSAAQPYERGSGFEDYPIPAPKPCLAVPTARFIQSPAEPRSWPPAPLNVRILRLGGAYALAVQTSVPDHIGRVVIPGESRTCLGVPHRRSSTQDSRTRA
jgi:hypothetical protein